MKLDSNVKNKEYYEVISIYFDSPYMKAFYEKNSGIKNRVKLRIRYYPDLQNKDKKELVFIELKKKYNENVVKTRLIVPFELAPKIVNNSTQEAKNFYEKASKDDKRSLEEIWFLYNRYYLRPVSAVCYKREPYVDKMENRFRITFDTEIKVRDYNFDLHSTEGNKYILPPHFCVMEVKFSNFIPNWAIKILQRNNVMKQKVSKFASGLERELIYSLI